MSTVLQPLGTSNRTEQKSRALLLDTTIVHGAWSPRSRQEGARLTVRRRCLLYGVWRRPLLGGCKCTLIRSFFADLGFCAFYWYKFCYCCPTLGARMRREGWLTSTRFFLFVLCERIRSYTKGVLWDLLSVPWTTYPCTFDCV